MRYNILKLAHESTKHGEKVVNLFKIGDPLALDAEKLQKIYFYLQDEGLISFHALGGDFSVTTKGIQPIEKKYRQNFLIYII
jgi:hypothetical protein